MDSPHSKVTGTATGAGATGAAIRAEGFGLKGPRGWAFRGIGVDAAPGSLVAVTGPPDPAGPACCSPSPAA